MTRMTLTSTPTGDIRAAVSVAVVDISSTATAQIFWRRRDPNLGVKLPVITDAAGARVPLVSAHYERSCGVLTFEASAGAGTYYVYYLPWVQQGQVATHRETLSMTPVEGLDRSSSRHMKTKSSASRDAHRRSVGRRDWHWTRQETQVC